MRAMMTAIAAMALLMACGCAGEELTTTHQTWLYPWMHAKIETPRTVRWKEVDGETLWQPDGYGAFRPAAAHWTHGRIHRKTGYVRAVWIIPGGDTTIVYYHNGGVDFGNGYRDITNN